MIIQVLSSLYVRSRGWLVGRTLVVQAVSAAVGPGATNSIPMTFSFSISKSVTVGVRTAARLAHFGPTTAQDSQF